MLEHLTTAAATGSYANREPRICWSVPTGFGKGHIIMAVALIWSARNAAHAELNPTKAEVHVLCCTEDLSKRDGDDFGGIYKNFSHPVKYHHDFEEFSKIRVGLLFIDEIDDITHHNFAKFTAWAQATKK
jgi:hypothetical protein